MRLRLFETQSGLSWLARRNHSEPRGLIAGGRQSEGWLSGKDKVDFYDLKGQGGKLAPSR